VYQSANKGICNNDTGWKFKIEMTRFVFSNFLFSWRSCCLWYNVENYEQPDRAQVTIWRMRFACWITKTTDTQWEYVLHMLLYGHCGCLSVSISTAQRLGSTSNYVATASFHILCHLLHTKVPSLDYSHFQWVTASPTKWSDDKQITVKCVCLRWLMFWHLRSL
jgi:hypothetical protein